MNFKALRIHIGLRTVKTVAAVIISMLIVDQFGTSTSKLLFAMMGAMAAVQPTFKESIESCITQTAGVLFGAIVGLLLNFLPLPQLISTAVGILLVITMYNFLHIRFSPSLSCFIVVMICTTTDLHPLRYASERIWDTAIGLAVGMILNSLVFPYDNSRKIRTTAESLDKSLIDFIENLFDGDDQIPNADEMHKNIKIFEQQLQIFSNQKLIMRLRRQQEELETFRACEVKARMLVSQMEVLSTMGRPGRLTESNRHKLSACGANIKDERVLDAVTEKDVVTNYHITQILTIRRELLSTLRK